MKKHPNTRHLARAAMLLLVAMLTSIAAWAQNGFTTYTYTYTMITKNGQVASKLTSSSSKSIEWSNNTTGGLWPANETKSITEDAGFTISFTPSQNTSQYNGFTEDGTFTIATAETDDYYIRKVTINYNRTNQGSTSTPVTAINSKSVSVAVAKKAGTGSNPISYEFVVELTDKPYYSVSPGTGLEIDNTNGFDHDGKTYFHPDATITIKPTSATNFISSVTTPATGAIIAKDKRSFTFTMPSEDITPSATLLSGFTISLPNTLTVTTKPNATVNGVDYYLPETTITVKAVNQYHIIEDVSGITGANIAEDNRSFTFTMPSAPTSISATTTEVHTVSVPDGFTIDKPYHSYDNKNYYQTGETYTLTVSENQIIYGTPTVTGTGATLTVADNRKSIFLTIGTADITGITATLATLSGSWGKNGDNVTWQMTDEDNDNTYETLTISGTGEMKDNPGYSQNAPWFDHFRETITTINIADGITYIGEDAFVNISNLTEITLPASVSKIGQYGIWNCQKLSRINIQNTNGIVTWAGAYCIGKNAANLVIAVPLALAKQYATADDWKAFNIRAALGSQTFSYSETDRDGNAATLAYKIATTDDLEALAEAVNSGTETANLTFRQTADIAFGSNTENNHTAIGCAIKGKFITYRYFNGNYDGQKFVISGINIRKTGTLLADDNQGLFGCTSNQSTISNVILDGCTFYCHDNVAPIAGSNSAKATNCIVLNTTVTATYHTSASAGTLFGNGSGNYSSNNYYYNCTRTRGTTNPDVRTTNCATNNGDDTRNNAALSAHLLTFGEGVSTTAEPAFTYNGVNYYAQGKEITITPADDNKAFASITGVEATIAADNRSATFTMPQSDVTVSATSTNIPVPYIDENGNENPCTDYTVLTAEMAANELPGGWYVLENSDPNYTDLYLTNTLWFSGDVNLILADGADMGVVVEKGDAINVAGKLTVYGQSNQTGTLYASGRENGINAENGIVVNGGCVKAYGDYEYGFNGGENGVDIHLKHYNSYILGSSYREPVTVSGLALHGYENDGIYEGDLNEAQIENMAYQYQLLEPCYVVKFDKNDGESDTEFLLATFDKNGVAHVAKPDDPTRDGYKFLGWFTLTGNDISDEKFDFDKPVTANTDLVAQWEALPPVQYIDADGAEKSVSTYTVLTADMDVSNLPGGWYVAQQGTVVIGGQIKFDGDAHLILADGADLRVNVSDNPSIVASGSLSIYAQQGGSGSLTVSGSLTINSDYAQYGGQVEVKDLSVVNQLSLNLCNRLDLFYADKASYGSIYIENQLIDNELVTYQGSNIANIDDKLLYLGYVVTFDMKDGSEPVKKAAIFDVEDNAYATKPADPTRSGYKFLGWFTLTGNDLSDENSYTKFDFDAPVTANIDLYARWEDGSEVEYIDENGDEKICTEYTLLTGKEEPDQEGYINLTAGWYVVRGKVNYANCILIQNVDTHIILCDDAEMICDVSNESAIASNQPLTIYGQRNGTGRLTATNNQNATIANSNDITINGGIVAATCTQSYEAIASNSNIIINGGKVSATGGERYQNIYAIGTITINGDRVESFNIALPTEKQKVVVKRTFTQGINSTIMLPFSFDATSFSGGAFYTLISVAPDEETGIWKATPSAPITSVKANTPYIFVPAKSGEIEFAGTSLEATASGDFSNACDEKGEWTLHGVYEKTGWTARQSKIYGFASASGEGKDKDGNEIGEIQAGEFVRAGIGASVRAMRAYLQYSGTDAALSKSAMELPERIVVVFPDETASVIDPDDPTQNSGDDIETPTSEINPAANVKVWSYDKTIYLAAAPNTPYTVIDLAGRTLITATTATDRDEIHLPGSVDGIVIVRIANQSFKIKY